MVLATYRVDDELPAEVRRLAGELRRRRSVVAIELAPLARDDVARQLEAIAGGPVARRSSTSSTLVRAATRSSARSCSRRARRCRRRSPRRCCARGRAARPARALAVLAAARRAGAVRAARRGSRSTPDALRAALDAGRAGARARWRGVPAWADRRGRLRAADAGRAGAVAPRDRRALTTRRSARTTATGRGCAARRSRRRSRPGTRPRASSPTPRRPCTSSGRSSSPTRPSTASSCSPAPPRPRASAATRSAPSRAAARRSRSSPTSRARARLYERLGEYHFWDDEAALACYEEALRLRPGEPRLLAAKGHALMGLRRWEEARACCEAALEAGAAPRITLGVVLAFLGEIEAGEAYLREALELSDSGEDTARAYMHLGELLRVRGDHGGALQAMVDGEREARAAGAARLVRALHVRQRRRRPAAARALGRGGGARRGGRADGPLEDRGRAAARDRRPAARRARRARGRARRRSTPPPTTTSPPSSSRRWPRPAPRSRSPRATRRSRRCTSTARSAASRTRSTPRRCTRSALRVEAERAEHERAHRRAPDRTRAEGLLGRLEALAGPPDSLAHLALARAELARVDGARCQCCWRHAAVAFDALARAVSRGLRAPSRGRGDAARRRGAGWSGARARRGARDRRGARRRAAARRRGRARAARAARAARRARARAAPTTTAPA